jgi:AmmeMemoRadiSam system protein B
MPEVRHPVIAGQFYEGTPEALEASLRECFLHSLGPGALPTVDPAGPGLVSAVVCPHAGYVYSGPAAAHSYAALAADGLPETVVILGPSHHTAARSAALSLVDAWRTPFGDVPIDRDLGCALVDSSPLFERDESTHRYEHSLEVQVPFLQFIYGDRVPAILPICVRSHPSYDVGSLLADSQAMGEALAAAAGSRRIALIASSDFSHQVPHEVAERQDRRALDAIESMDPGALLEVVARHRISMCGPVPVAIALFHCLSRGPHAAQLLRYYTSGDIVGDRRAVVGYASLTIRAKVGPPP